MGNASEYKTFNGQIGKKAYEFLLQTPRQPQVEQGGTRCHLDDGI